MTQIQITRQKFNAFQVVSDVAEGQQRRRYFEVYDGIDVDTDSVFRQASGRLDVDQRRSDVGNDDRFVTRYHKDQACFRED